MLRKSLLGIILLLAAVVAMACSSGGSGQTAVSTTVPANAGGQARVAMQGFKFVPADLTVKAGTTVIWENQDAAGHTVTSGTRGNASTLFESGNVAGSKTFSFTFGDPGVYPYHCKTHQGMDGQITVQ
jgi:plastocyanin